MTSWMLHTDLLEQQHVATNLAIVQVRLRFRALIGERVRWAGNVVSGACQTLAGPCLCRRDRKLAV